MNDGSLTVHTPGHVHTIGDHTDHTGGLVLPIAIDRWTRALCRGRSHGPGPIRAASAAGYADRRSRRGAAIARSGKVCLYPSFTKNLGGDVETAGLATSGPLKDHGFGIGIVLDPVAVGSAVILRGSWAYTAP